MTIPLSRAAATAVALSLLCLSSASGLTIREYRKYTQEKQGIFVIGAVSMAAYMHASNGETVKARCIMDWFFGKLGQETPGPNELAVEIAVAEQSDPDKFHVEGVILGLTDKVCEEPPSSNP